MTLDDELLTELNGDAGAVIEDLLRRNVLMPVSELDRALKLQVSEGHLIPEERLEYVGRDDGGCPIYRLRAA